MRHRSVKLDGFAGVLEREQLSKWMLVFEQQSVGDHPPQEICVNAYSRREPRTEDDIAPDACESSEVGGMSKSRVRWRKRVWRVGDVRIGNGRRVSSLRNATTRAGEGAIGFGWRGMKKVCRSIKKMFCWC